MQRFARNGLILGAIALGTMVLAWSYLGNAPLIVQASMQSLRGKVAGADFPTELDWINTNGKTLSLTDLRGRVVLLDFWTYGCINCMHIIPDLKRLEQEFGDALVVIGVHSAKFKTEGNTRRIRSIVHRYEREHPVVNDRAMQIWRSYFVRAWPTLVLLDPAGNVVGSVSGEGNYEVLREAIQKLVSEFDDSNELDTTPLGFKADWANSPDTLLSFPGKILADQANQRLFISDTNHHRILISNFDGEILETIGNGTAGLADGSYTNAQFKQPQGLSFDGKKYLYVADTENHALRRVNLDTRSVETLAGTGKQKYLSGDEYKASGSGMNSPWDVKVGGNSVYIAMAGQHQLWRYDIANDRLIRFAGTGREALLDGNRLNGALNQPSGLALHGTRLYFADAEASAIRYAEITDNGRMETVVGTGLFDFGDRDGQGRQVLLQHPLGVDVAGGTLYISDTYNDKIKRIDPETATVTTVTGGAELLNEPGGLSVVGERIYIADTNNHAIKVYNLKSKTLETLNLRF